MNVWDKNNQYFFWQIQFFFSIFNLFIFFFEIFFYIWNFNTITRHLAHKTCQETKKRGWAGTNATPRAPENIVRKKCFYSTRCIFFCHKWHDWDTKNISVKSLWNFVYLICKFWLLHKKCVFKIFLNLQVVKKRFCEIFAIFRSPGQMQKPYC